jgi:hypothetical protein
MLAHSLRSGTLSTQPARHVSTRADPGKHSLPTPDRQNLPDMSRRPADIRLQSRADPPSAQVVRPAVCSRLFSI